MFQRALVVAPFSAFRDMTGDIVSISPDMAIVRLDGIPMYMKFARFEILRIS